MRKNLYISIVGCGIAIAASYGCAKESLDTKTQSQAIVYENLGIGEGFDTREAADSKYTGTGNSCVLNNSVTFKDEPRDRSRISSFYSRDKVTLDNEIKADLDVDVGFGEKDSVLSLGIDNTFVYAQDVAQEGVVLTFAATITTRTRF